MNITKLVTTLTGLKSKYGRKDEPKPVVLYKGERVDYDQMEQEMEQERRKIMREVEVQDKAFERICKARDEYADDLDALIGVYEEEVRENPTGVNWSYKYYMTLSKMYYENGQRDKAWGFLNEMVMTHPELIEHVRKEQVRILKKERRWLEALRTFCLQSYHAAERPNYGAERFVREGRPIANKLGLSESQMFQIGSEVIRQARSPLSDESKAGRTTDRMIEEYLSLADD